jgi:hypothetical protein
LTQSAHLAVQVFKLHGSLNWAYPGQRGKKLTAFQSYSDVLAAGFTPSLVPPTWKKGFYSQHEDVWTGAVAALASATRIVVIGFSMPATDQHFRYLLASGLRSNISLRQLVFVDPYIESVQRRALTFLREELVERGMLHFAKRSALSLFSKEGLELIGRPLADGARPA